LWLDHNKEDYYYYVPPTSCVCLSVAYVGARARQASQEVSRTCATDTDAAEHHRSDFVMNALNDRQPCAV